MSIENNIENTEANIVWTATAERFKNKIDRKRDEYLKIGGENNPHIQLLNDLESTIDSIFPIYEDKNMTIQQVEDDLKYRIENSDNEDDKVLYEKILNMIDSRDF